MRSELHSDFGQRLHLVRIARCMDQREMAELLGVTQRAVSFWETGAREPTTKEARRYAEILGVPFEWLCGWGYDFDYEQGDDCCERMAN